MIYIRSHTRPHQRRSRALIGAGAALVLIIGLIQFFSPHFLPALFTGLFRPFWRLEFSISGGALQTPAGLLASNEELRRQIAEDQVRLAGVQALESENIELRNIFGHASSTSRMLAPVLKRPPAAPYDELIIDGGADRGFLAGNKVYAPGNVLIGQITDVLGQTSKVVLFSSPGQKYDVQIGSSHAPAVAVGRGGGQYQAELPRDAKIAEGDAVINSSLNDRVFGIVSSVITDPAQPFEKVLFAAPVNIYQLRWVLVDVKIQK